MVFLKLRPPESPETLKQPYPAVPGETYIVMTNDVTNYTKTHHKSYHSLPCSHRNQSCYIRYVLVQLLKQTDVHFRHVLGLSAMVQRFLSQEINMSQIISRKTSSRTACFRSFLYIYEVSQIISFKEQPSTLGAVFLKHRKNSPNQINLFLMKATTQKKSNCKQTHLQFSISMQLFQDPTFVYVSKLLGAKNCISWFRLFSYLSIRIQHIALNNAFINETP